MNAKAGDTDGMARHERIPADSEIDIHFGKIIHGSSSLPKSRLRARSTPSRGAAASRAFRSFGPPVFRPSRASKTLEGSGAETVGAALTVIEFDALHTTFFVDALSTLL